MFILFFMIRFLWADFLNVIFCFHKYDTEKRKKALHAEHLFSS